MAVDQSFTVLQKESEGRGRFYITGDRPDQGDRAKMEYHMWDEQQAVNIDHTEVNELLQGQGVGKQMLESLITWAKNNNLKVSSTCPFATAILDKDTQLGQGMRVDYKR